MLYGGVAILTEWRFSFVYLTLALSVTHTWPNRDGLLATGRTAARLREIDVNLKPQ